MTATETASHIEQIDRYLSFAGATGQISKRQASAYRAERSRAVSHLMAITAPTDAAQLMSDEELLAELRG